MVCGSTHIKAFSQDNLCACGLFFQHLIRPEVDIEKATGVSDPGLNFVGQGRLERKEVKPGWNGQVGGVGFSGE